MLGKNPELAENATRMRHEPASTAYYRHLLLAELTLLCNFHAFASSRSAPSCRITSASSSGHSQKERLHASSAYHASSFPAAGAITTDGMHMHGLHRYDMCYLKIPPDALYYYHYLPVI